MKNTKVLCLAFLGFFTLTACGGNEQAAQLMAESALDNAGCKLSQSEMWNVLQQISEEGASFPDPATLRNALMTAGHARGFSGEALSNYVEAFLSNYATVTEGVRKKLGPSSAATWKKALAEAEIGIRTTEAHKELQSEVQISQKTLMKAERELQAACANPDRPLAPPPARGDLKSTWEQLRQKNPEVFGARKTLAVAYQSCDVLNLDPMTAQTAAVRGIQIVGNHPSGGKKREISSVADVNATHYYIKNMRLAKNTCFEVRKSPLIYDFGGKPFTTSKRPKLLNMFKNGGSGGTPLGIDCSAFVFSSLALAGLKLDPDPAKPLKADLVHGIGSAALKEPQSNGLRCLQKISVSGSQSIAAGDIVAINGHVVMIDEVGEDPFGLKAIQKPEDCNSTKIIAANFDFVVAQSSPSKNGIGINRYHAREYSKESSTYRNGFVAYASAACRAKFGLSPNLNSPNLSIVRHKKTVDCRDEALVAENETCVDSCQAF